MKIDGNKKLIAAVLTIIGVNVAIGLNVITETTYISVVTAALALFGMGNIAEKKINGNGR